MILRDPRASLAGYWYEEQMNLECYLPIIHLIIVWIAGFYGTSIIKDSYYKIKKNLYIIKNEDMHSNLKKK